MYGIEFSKGAEKEFYELGKDIQKRISGGLDRIKIRPHSHIKKLVGCPYFSFRVGDYRIILDIQRDKLIIFVVTLGHRKSIYSNL